METIILGILALATVVYAVKNLRDRNPVVGAVLLVIASTLGTVAYCSAQMIGGVGVAPGDLTPTLPESERRRDGL